jgi:hypothetical protein
LLTDCEESPGDGSGTSSVSLLRGESVGGGSGLKEDKRKEDEDLGPQSSVVLVSVDTERLEEGKDNENDSPYLSM